MKKFSRLLSVALSLAMCAGMVSPAFAVPVALHEAIDVNTGEWNADKQKEALNDETGQEEYFLEKNMVSGWQTDANGKRKYFSDGLKDTVEINDDRNVVIDLNGYTLDGSSYNAIKVNDATLTVKDSSEDQTGKITSRSQNSNDDENTLIVEGGGTLNLESGTIENTYGNSNAVLARGEGTTVIISEGATVAGGSTMNNGIGLVVSDGAEAVIDGGIVKGKTAVYADSGSTVVINGGTVASESGYTNSYGVRANNGSSVEVNGGTITGKKSGAYAENNSTITIREGTNVNKTNADSTSKVEYHTHTPAEAVKKNEVAATCTEDGSYDVVIYCSGCDKEISHEAKTIPATGHTEITDAAVAPTCTETGLTAGSHCSICEKVLAAQETVAATGHAPGEAKHENVIDAQIGVAGTYDEVVYCTNCEMEISRTSHATAALPVPPVVVVPGGDDVVNDTSVIEIEDTDVPLAGPVIVRDVVAELFRLTNGVKGTHAEVIAWAIEKEIISKEDVADEVITVAQLREILANYAAAFEMDVDVYALTTLTGADNDIALNCNEVLAEFFGEKQAG